MVDHPAANDSAVEQRLHRFFSARTGAAIADLRPGQVAVATCDRRTYVERGYGFVRLLWVLLLRDRAVVSVHPAALARVSRLAWTLRPEDAVSTAFTAQAADALHAALAEAGACGGGPGVILYHPGGATPRATDGVVRALTPADGERWPGRRVYTSASHPSVARGEASGLFLGETLVAEVITHDPPVVEMAHLVAENGIEVAEGYRGKGYGAALLAVWTAEMQKRGRTCLHSTSPANEASLAVARSVGYLEYARTWGITWSAPARDDE